MEIIQDAPVIFIGRRKKAILFWVLNTAFWLFFILREYMAVRYFELDEPYAGFLSSLTYLIGFLFSVIIRYSFIALSSRIRSLTRLTVLFTGILIVISILWKLSDMMASYPFWNEKRQAYFNGLSWMDHFMDSFGYLLTMLVWGAVYYIVFLWERMAVQGYKKKEAESLANRARFQMLQNQLNPHFLFNSLNSLRALIFENPQKAADLVTELSDFLRYNLRQSDQFRISVEQEISAVRNYLSIEKKRYEEDLQFKIDLDPGCRNFVIIPNLLLPLADNAVKYGMLTGPVPLKIDISVRKSGEKLMLEVCNTGCWSDEGKSGSGMGIQNVKERLDNAYKEKYDFSILKETGSVKVVIQIPYRNE